ncbi:hypothetical protein FIU85_19815 [Roseovarius sp. THAF8]|uniref:hypothetical protein n=1 Tax=Roseovarius sp. THAF8 TaxID=2587846 RepID=UPI001268CA61|nr:hypothetical protein [Roseovarius sp. THAF8]QFT99573.1 hypothetical protein FIU85_19815 [Roseovarius sp. THAF8]
MSLSKTVLDKTSLPKAVLFTCALCLPFKPAFACMPLNEPLGISICLDDTSWEPREDAGDDFLFYNTAVGFAANVRIFDGGTNDGLESERAACRLAEADSEETRDFALLQAGKVASGNFVYVARGSRDGRSNIYVNTVSVGPTKTLRLTTWRLGDRLSDSDRDMHIAFGNLLKTER